MRRNKTETSVASTLPSRRKSIPKTATQSASTTLKPNGSRRPSKVDEYDFEEDETSSASSLRNMFGEYHGSIKNDDIDHIFTSPAARNTDYLDELLGKTMAKAKKDIETLSQLTKQKLGKKAYMYQTQAEKQQIQEGEMDDDFSSSQDAFSKQMDKTTNALYRQIKHGNADFGDGLGRVQNKEQLLLTKIMDAMNPKDDRRRQQTATQTYLREIFSRLRSLIEHLWEEMHIPTKKRDKFSKQYFYPETLMNYLHVYSEISRLCNIRSIQHVVLKHIEQREVYIKRLKEIARSVGTTTENLIDHPLIRNELPSIIASLRNVTVDLVEAIFRWRKELPVKQEFHWNGHNYLLTMQNDLDFLKLTELAPLFDFPLDQNPLLLPPSMRWENIVNNQSTSASSTLMNSHFSNKKDERLATVTAKKFSQLQHQRIYAILTLNSEQLERIRQAEKIIFQEQLFIQYLKLQKVKNEAAIIIQCAFRSYRARKTVSQMIAEHEMKMKYAKSEIKRKAKIKRTFMRTAHDKYTLGSSYIANIEEEVNAQGAAEERKEKFLGTSIKLNGRYVASLNLRPKKDLESLVSTPVPSSHAHVVL